MGRPSEAAAAASAASASPKGREEREPGLRRESAPSMPSHDCRASAVAPQVGSSAHCQERKRGNPVGLNGIRYSLAVRW